MIYDETYGNFLNPKCWEHNPTPNINNPCICLMAIGSIYIGSTGRIFVRTKRVNEHVCRQIDWEEVIAEGGDNYLLGANYNNTTNILTLTLVSGDIFTIDLNDLVDPPSVVTANLPQGSWVHNNGGGTLTTIKSTSSDIDNILNIGTDGGTYLTLSQLITLLTGENFGLHLAYNTSTNQVSLLDNDNQVINTVTINNVTLSESNGVLTLTNLNGNQTFIDLKQVAASNPSSGVYQILDDYGNTITIDTNETLTSLSLIDCTLSYIDEDGDTTNIDLTSCITNNQTLTSLSYNAGVLTYTDEDGNDTELNIGVENFLSAANYNNTLHQLTLTLTNGSSFIVDLSDLVDEFSVDVLDSSSINYSISGTGTSVDPFIIGGSVTLSEDAGNGLEIRADGLYVNITNATETLTVISLLNNVITYVDENGDSTNLTLPITSLVDNGNGTLTFTNEIGDQLTFNKSSGAETVTTLVDNEDGTYTYTSEDDTE
ncbi:MAG: hypothetical protein KDH96_11105, partial [Candidatus Riesia sp.]|nr:hypothetical protein [Candidatus Riesia sp.]